MAYNPLTVDLYQTEPLWLACGELLQINMRINTFLIGGSNCDELYFNILPMLQENRDDKNVEGINQSHNRPMSPQKSNILCMGIRSERKNSHQ